MSKIIELIISPDGKASVQTKGFTGESCRQASKFLEQALGQAGPERLTPEFFLAQTHLQQDVRSK